MSDKLELVEAPRENQQVSRTLLTKLTGRCNRGGLLPATQAGATIDHTEFIPVVRLRKIQG